MLTTRLLKSSKKELLKDRIKLRTKHMYEANLRHVKSEIDASFKDMQSIDYLELLNLVDFVSSSLIELESAIGNILDVSIFESTEDCIASNF